jgi:nitroreductase
MLHWLQTAATCSSGSFHWVRDEEKKKKLIHACLNQSAAKTAQELVVIVTRRDKWRQRVQWHKNLILKDAERVGRDAKSIKNATSLLHKIDALSRT